MSMAVAAPAVDAHTRRWLGVRLAATALVLTGLFAAIAWKAWTLQIRDGDKMRALGEAQYLRDLELPAPRGMIVDRNGVPLAVSVEAQSVFVRPRTLADVHAAAVGLAHALGMDENVLEAKLSAGKPFVWVKRRITPDEAKAVAALNLAGVTMTPEPKRFYPAGNLAGPILGAAGIDGHGIDGLEKSLDVHLLADKEHHRVLRDARGHVLYDGGWTDAAADAPSGDTVELTIDRYIQYVAEKALYEGVIAHQAKAGVAIVLDARTSEILAMASVPTFDPNATDNRDGARNRAVTDVYEPGSGMKVFSVSSALEAGAIKADDTFTVDGGRLQVGKKTIKDVHYKHPVLSVTSIVAESSNVGASKIAFRLGKEGLAAGLRRFGFGTETGVDLPGERQGVVRDVKRWGDIGLATTSFGYGLLVTPLQMAAALASIAHGGIWQAPRIVREVRAPDGRVVSRPEAVTRRVLSPQNAHAMIQMMKAVLEPEGTGEKLKTPGWKVAGKTGTAHKVDMATHRYSEHRYLSSFIGIAPADDPRIVIVVMIDEPQGDAHYGGVVAGPVFVDIVEDVLPYLGVPAAPSELAEMAAAKAAKEARAARLAGRPAAKALPPVVSPAVEDAPIEGDDDGMAAASSDLDDDASSDVPPAGPGSAIVVIPDFRGMSVTQAVAAAHAAGVRVSMDGSGRAVRQFPPPGRAVKSIACQVTFEPR